MGRILVLGGTGFIGHHIVRELLSRGEAVSVLARPGSDRSLLDGMPVEFYEGDIERSGDVEDALEGADALVNVAAPYPVYSFGVNRQLGISLRHIGRIHKAMARRNVRRYLFVSTLSAVGRYGDSSPEDEAAPFPAQRYRGAYATIKRAMQDEVLSHAARFNTVIVAPTAVFGEGDRKPTTGRILLDIAKRKLPVTLKGRTNVVDVHSVAWGVAEALSRGSTGRLYVLGGENITLHGFIARVARIADVPSPLISLPPISVLPLAWASEGIGKLLRMRRPFLPVVGVDFARYGEYISSGVAMKELGYDPERSNAEAAIRRAFNWFREQGMLPPRQTHS